MYALSRYQRRHLIVFSIPQLLMPGDDEEAALAIRKHGGFAFRLKSARVHI